MQEKAVVVCKAMRSVVCDCQYHESFFPSSVADITVARLLLFCIACPSVSASMASIFDSLTTLMHPNLAFWAVNNGVWEFPNVTETRRTRGSQQVSCFFRIPRFLFLSIFFELWNRCYFIKRSLKIIVVFIVLESFMIIEKVNRLFAEGVF